jgi:hypothetical protein
VKLNSIFPALLVSVIALSNLSASAANLPKFGASCAKLGVGKTQTYKGLKYTCIKSGKKLVWSKGVPVTKPQPTQTSSPSPTISMTPTATPTPSPTPTPTSTPTPTPTQKPLSISEKWSQIDPSALKFFNEWAVKELPKNHSVKIEYVLSDKADKEVVEEIKKRYELAARFWAPYSTVTKEFKVLIANHNEFKWICDIKRSWLQISQPDCEEVESNGRSDIPTAGQSQVKNRNVDMYQVKNRLEMDTLFFVGRIEHEFTHNIFYEQSDQYQNFMPCWQIEGGAEFFGILIANRNDADLYIQARNIKFETDFLNLKELSWSLADWIDFLNEIDRTDVPNRQGDTCGPVRPKIYHHSVLANEYLVSKVGIPGYLKLIRDASVTSWSETIKRTFGMEKKDFYREMATYVMMQYRLARENSWSYQDLRKIPFGR